MAFGAPILILSALIFGALFAAPRDNSNRQTNGIIARLERIENNQNAALTSATFCYSQGIGLELAGSWAGQVAVAMAAGAGWNEVGKAEIFADYKQPFILPFIPPPPAPPLLIPIPTEAKVEGSGHLGRGFDVCVQIPLKLTPNDTAKLEQIRRDINSRAGDGLGEKGKFQRRAARLIDFAGRKVPGNQNTDADVENDLDRADAAADSFITDGVVDVSEGLDVFRDHSIAELLATLDMPAGVSNFMQDPEQIFDWIPDVSGGLGHVACDDLDLSNAMRSRLPRLDGLCNQVENLPSFDLVRDVPLRVDEVSDDVLQSIAELLDPLLADKGETKEQTKKRFCQSPIGQRKVFDKYCGR